MKQAAVEVKFAAPGCRLTLAHSQVEINEWLAHSAAWIQQAQCKNGATTHINELHT
jgi:hypothetical protein